jgi:hypothetical protein
MMIISGSLNTKPLNEDKFGSAEDFRAILMERFQQQSTKVLCGEDPSTGMSVGCLSQHTSPPPLVQQSLSVPGFCSNLPPDMPVPSQFPLCYYIQQH